MARTAVDEVVSSSGGVPFGFVAAPDLQLSIPNPLGDMALVVKNGSLAEITATVSIPKVVDGQAVASKVSTIAAGAIALIGPFNRSLYNQADGSVHVDLSATTDVEVSALKWVQP